MISWKSKTFAQLETDELLDILKLRQDVFIVEQKCTYNDIDSLDKSALHLFGYVLSGHAAKEICAYARIISPNAQYREASIGRVVVSASYRERALGVALMRKALEICAQYFSGFSVRISAQAHLKKFYKGIGFKVVSEPYDEDGILHIDMLRQG